MGLCWKKYFVWIDKRTIELGIFLNLFNLVGLQSHLLDLFAITGWYIWNRRDKTWLGGKCVAFGKNS